MWDKEDNMATINSDAILEGFYNSKNATGPMSRISTS